MHNDGSNNRRDSQNPQFGQPRTDGGLLEDALFQISGRVRPEGTTQRDGIQSEDERQSRNRQDEENLEHFAKSQDAWIEFQALESIKSHNGLFPETALKIVAFGRSFDEFTAIMEQQNIDGNFATKEEIAVFVKERFGAVKDDSVLGGTNICCRT